MRMWIERVVANAKSANTNLPIIVISRPMGRGQIGSQRTPVAPPLAGSARPGTLLLGPRPVALLRLRLRFRLRLRQLPALCGAQGGSRRSVLTPIQKVSDIGALIHMTKPAL